MEIIWDSSNFVIEHSTRNPPTSKKVTLPATRNYFRNHTDCPSSDAAKMSMDSILSVFRDWASSDSDTESDDIVEEGGATQRIQLRRTGGGFRLR